MNLHPRPSRSTIEGGVQYVTLNCVDIGGFGGSAGGTLQNQLEDSLTWLGESLPVEQDSSVKTKVKLRAIIHGRVQKVRFRRFVHYHAQRLALVGWTGNLPGGAVEICVEGPRENLERLLEELKIGPPRAEVSAVEVEWADADNSFDSFVMYR